MKKHRSEAGQLLLEGERLVEDALLSALPVRCCIVEGEKEDRYAHIVSAARDRAIPVLRASARMTAKLSDTPHPQGVFAVVAQPPTDAAAAIAAAPAGRPLFALHGISDPGNLGTIARSTEWFGGGALLLAIMANLVPPVALIPVHGVIQFGSNVFRAGVLIRHVHWPGFAAFSLGAVIGVSLGGAVAVNLPAAAVQIGVGGFVIWSVLGRPPRWLSRWSVLTGMISSFLTMFFGATGVFVANYTKSLSLPRREHVATHAVMMTLQHVLKTLTFGALGFAFGPWLGFIVMMIACGLAGTLTGKLLLDRLSDHNFKRALDAVLVLISLRLVWNGLRALL